MGKGNPANIGRSRRSFIKPKGNRKSICKKCKLPINYMDWITCIAGDVPGSTRWVHTKCAGQVPQEKEDNEPKTPIPESELEENEVEDTDMEEKRVETKPQFQGIFETMILDIVRGEIKTAIENIEIPHSTVTVEVKYPDFPEKPTKQLGTLHNKFSEVKNLIECGENVMLKGPMGCGKTTLAKQIADYYDLPFSMVSCTSGMSEGDLLGRLLPTGDGGKMEYHPSMLVKLYENGGVFLFDEFDAADENTILSINAAMSNGIFPVYRRIDNPIAHKSKDKPFIGISACNTFGTGADRIYVGRTQLDGATLDRWAKVILDFDPIIEEMMCPNAMLRERCRSWREKAHNAKLRREVSPRFMKRAFMMFDKGHWTMDDVFTQLTIGWTEDEINAIKD